MPELIDSASGAPVSVSDAETPFVVGQGKLALPSIVTMASPSGARYDFPGDSVKIRSLMSHGWRMESPEETKHLDVVRKYGDSEFRTGIEGAASAATLGLSDVLQTKTGITTPEALAGRREANPNAYAVGQIGGIAASLLVPGAAEGALLRGAETSVAGKTLGMAARLATAPARVAEGASQAAAEVVGALLPAAAGSSTMARMLASGAKLGTQGVVDGALFGTGQLVSEHALGDTDLNTDRIISHIGMSALISGALGGGLGAVLGEAAPLAEAARRKIFDNLDKIPGISRESAAAFLEKQANRAALASVGATSAMYRKLRKDELMDIGPETFREIMHKKIIGEGEQEIVKETGEKVLRTGRQFDDITKRLTETVDAIGHDVGSQIDAIDAAGLNAGYAPQDISKRLTKNVLNPLKGQIATGGAKSVVQTILDDLAELPDSPVTHRWLQDMRGNLRDAYLGDPDKLAKKAGRKIERELNEILEESMKAKLSPEEFSKFKENKDLYHSLKTIEHEAAIRSDVIEGNRMFSLSDRITAASTTAGAMAGAYVGDQPIEGVAKGAALGYAAQILARQYRTRLPSVLAVLLGKASKMMAAEVAIKAASSTESAAIGEAVAHILSSKPATTAEVKIPQILDEIVNPASEEAAIIPKAKSVAGIHQKVEGPAGYPVFQMGIRQPEKRIPKNPGIYISGEGKGGYPVFSLGEKPPGGGIHQKGEGKAGYPIFQMGIKQPARKGPEIIFKGNGEGGYPIYSLGVGAPLDTSKAQIFHLKDMGPGGYPVYQAGIRRPSNGGAYIKSINENGYPVYGFGKEVKNEASIGEIKLKGISKDGYPVYSVGEDDTAASVSESMKHEPTVNEFVKQQADTVVGIESNPEAQEEVRHSVEMSLGEVAPEISRAITSKIISAISFLASKAPRDPSPAAGSLTPDARSYWVPSNSQTLSYMRYANAINNPAEVISSIARGKSNHEGMEVLNTLYPSLRNEIVAKFVERIATSKKPIPYNKRVALSVLLGIPNADPTLLPQYIAAMQAGFKQQPEQQTQQPITNNAVKSLGKTQQQNMTQTDRLASGQEL